MEAQSASGWFTAPPPGTRLGDFVLEEEIGRGGMGVVYRAWQESLQREVAVKLLRDSALAEPSLRARFRAEALAAAGLQHPGIVRVHGGGEADGVFFFAMDHVEGRSLAEMVRDDGPLEPARAAALAAELADAMQHAHDMGVVHRDLKPSNVLVDAQGRARVLDFGLARREGDASLTVSGDVLGTPGYMSPEQAAGNRADAGAPSVDVFGVGAVLYFMLTGRAPFTGDSASEVLRRASDGAVTPPRRLNARTPRALETICLKCLRREPGERYASAGELAADIRRFLSGYSILARPVSVIRCAREWLWRRPRGGALLFVLTAVLIACGLRLRHWWRHERAHQTVCLFPIRVKTGLEPVHSLTADEWQRRHISTRLTRRGSSGPVIKVESIAGDGSPRPSAMLLPFVEFTRSLPVHGLPVEAVITYDSHGRPLEETLRNAVGEIVGRNHWLHPMDGSADGLSARMEFIDASASPLSAGTPAFRALVTFDPRGKWTQIQHLDAEGRPAMADHGVYGRRVTRTSPGASWIVEFLDLDGSLMNNRAGIARTTEIWTPELRRRETRTFDRDGNPVASMGFHLAVTEFDAAGNPSCRLFFATDGFTPTWSQHPADKRAGRITCRFDRQGRLVEQRFMDFDPAKSSPWALILQTVTWPAEVFGHRRVLTQLFDANGVPVPQPDGYFDHAEDFDRNGRLLRILRAGWPAPRERMRHSTEVLYDNGPCAPETGRRSVWTDGVPGLTATVSER